MMQVSVREDRTIAQLGTTVGDLAGCVTEAVSPEVGALVLDVFRQMESGGAVRLSADHRVVEAVPPPQEVVDAQAARLAEQEAIRQMVAAHPDPLVQLLAQRAGLV